MGCLFTKHTARAAVAAMTDAEEYYQKFNLMAYQKPFIALGMRDTDIMQLHCTHAFVVLVRFAKEICIYFVYIICLFATATACVCACVFSCVQFPTNIRTD